MGSTRLLFHPKNSHTAIFTSRWLKTILHLFCFVFFALYFFNGFVAGIGQMRVGYKTDGIEILKNSLKWKMKEDVGNSLTMESR